MSDELKLSGNGYNEWSLTVENVQAEGVDLNFITDPSQTTDTNMEYFLIYQPVYGGGNHVGWQFPFKCIWYENGEWTSDNVISWESAESPNSSSKYATSLTYTQGLDSQHPELVLRCTATRTAVLSSNEEKVQENIDDITDYLCKVYKKYNNILYKKIKYLKSNYDTNGTLSNDLFIIAKNLDYLDLSLKYAIKTYYYFNGNTNKSQAAGSINYYYDKCKRFSEELTKGISKLIQRIDDIEEDDDLKAFIYTNEFPNQNSENLFYNLINKLREKLYVEQLSKE